VSAIRHLPVTDVPDEATGASSEVSIGDVPTVPLSLTERGLSSVFVQRVNSINMPPAKLSILMCAYNEQATIAQAMQAILEVEYPCEIELVVVDDGSTDATPTLIEQFSDSRVIFHRHPRNLGKGSALLSAVSLASGSHILPFDADLEYEPEDIPRLLAPVIKGRAEVVYGVRLFGINTVYHSYRYAVGNRMLTRIANLLFDSYLSDLHTCLKLMPLAMFKSLKLVETGFGLDTELTARLLRNGVRPFEISVSYFSRTHAQGKKITWRDAVACLLIMLRVRLSKVRHPAAVTARKADRGRSGILAADSRHGLANVTALVVGDDSEDVPAQATS